MSLFLAHMFLKVSASSFPEQYMSISFFVETRVLYTIILYDLLQMVDIVWSYLLLVIEKCVQIWSMLLLILETGF